MAGDQSVSVDDLRGEAGRLLERLGQMSEQERATAEARLRAINGELGRRSTGDDYDPDAVAARDNVARWMEQAHVPAEPPTDPGGSKQPQTRTGAGGAPALVAAPHGGIPDIPFTHDAMDALRQARCKLCTFLRDNPRPDPLKSDPATRATWADDRKRLLVDMILAEEEMLAAVTRHWVPYTADDERVLDGGYDAIQKLRAKFEQIAQHDATAADYTKRLADIEQIHEGLKQGLTGVKQDQTLKTAKTVNGLVDNIGKLVDQRELDLMTKGAGGSSTPGTAMKLVKDLRGQTANLEKLAKNTSANVAKMGGKGNFGQAYAGFAGGMYRLLHQETQRALMEVEGANHELVREVMDAREQLAEAHAQVLERRQGEALRIVNEYLDKAGEPPFQLHSMSDTDFANELDGKLQEMHLADSVERNFGTEASKRTTGLPTSKLGRFRKQHGKVFGAAEEHDLLAWCERNCPNKRVAAAPTPARRKTGLLVGGAVVGVAAITIGAVSVFGGGGDSAATVTIPATAAPVTDPPSTAPPATNAAPATPPATEPPVVTDPPIVADPPREPVAVGFRACPGTTHSPSSSFLDFPSFVWMWFSAVIEFSMESGGTSTERASGTLVVDTPDTAAESVEIGFVDGIGSGEVGIDHYGSYGFVPTVFITDDGRELPLVGDPILIDVGPEEGPAGGCTPVDQMTPDQRADEERRIIQDVLGADPNGGAGAGGGDTGGGTAIVVGGDDGAIPPPEDILAPYREFLTRFDTAMRAGDVDSLVSWISPAVLAIYGEQQCRAYLDNVVGSISDLFLVDGRLDSPWTFTDVDGGDAAAEVVGAFEVDIEMTVQGTDRVDSQLHLLDAPDGVVWFTDCGNPL